jgi:hypothetical protein
MNHKWFTLVACLFAGIALNLAVAWISLLLLLQQYHHGYPIVEKLHGPVSENGQWLVDVRRYPYNVRLTWVWTLGNRFEEYVDVDGNVQTVQRDGPAGVPSWSIAKGNYHGNAAPGEMHYEYALGWPFTSWYGAYEEQSEQSSWALKTKSNYFYYHPVLFVYRPIFLGFIYNTIIYSVLFFVTVRVLMLAMTKFVRLLRIRRGQCPRCGYCSDGLSTCPECGEVLKANATVAQ